MGKYKRLVDEYAYPGFRPLSRVRAHPYKEDTRIITLRRRQKKLYVEHAAQHLMYFMTENFVLSAISPVVMHGFILKLKYAVSCAGSAVK
jgi:hypothetical protein